MHHAPWRTWRPATASTHRHRGCAQASTRANLMRIAARRESIAEAAATERQNSVACAICMAGAYPYP